MFGGIPSFLSSSIADQLTNHLNLANTNSSATNNSSTCPPASRKVLSNLPLVTVTADDLLEASNKECTVCLDEQKLGSLACKLPCGHLFHKECVKDWLCRHCICPVCRLELETDDTNFEMARSKRMESRKIRIRLDELKAKSISQLKELCRSIGLNINGCIDKSEIIDRVAHSGKVSITARVPQMKMTEEELYSKNVAELRHLLLSFGLSCEGALEKSELRQKLLDSERIAIHRPSVETSDPSSYPAKLSANLKMSGEEAVSSEEQLNGKSPPFTSTQLREMKLSELRSLCEEKGVSIKDCIDKEEVLQRLLSSMNSASENSFSSSAASSSANGPPAPSSSILQLSRETLAQLPIKELKHIMNAYGVNSQNCLYRSDIIERLQTSKDIQIVD